MSKEKQTSSEDLDKTLSEQEDIAQEDVPQEVLKLAEDFVTVFKEEMSISESEIFQENELIFQEKALAFLKEHPDLKEKFTEEFINQLVSEMETLVKAKVQEKVQSFIPTKLEKVYESLIEASSELFLESFNTIQEDNSKKVDDFLNAYADKMFQENFQLVENAVKNEISDNLIKGIINLLQENSFELKDEKIDLYKQKVQELKDSETKLNESISENVNLENEVKRLKREKILYENTSDLSLIEKEKLSKLMEGTQIINDEDYLSKINSFKKEFLHESTKVPQNNEIDETVASLKIVSEEALNASKSEKISENVDLFTQLYNESLKNLKNAN